MNNKVCTLPFNENIYLTRKIFKTLAEWIAWLDYINLVLQEKLTMYIILKTNEARNIYKVQLISIYILLYAKYKNGFPLH